MQQSIQQQSSRSSPFQGPKPFTNADKDWFFGRDVETEELISLVLGHKVVLVYAQSGAGKTSLLNTKIIPELEENGLRVLPVARVGYPETETILAQREDSVNKPNTVKEYIRSPVTSKKLSFNPFMRIALQYLGQEHITNKLDDKSHSVLSDVTTLSDFLEKITEDEYKSGAKKKKPLVIIFDQLEELFRSSRDSSPEKQQEFFNQVANALDKESLSLRIILVIREDYLAHLDPFAKILPEKLRPRFRLERLNKEEAKEAIERPLIKAKEHFKEYGINERIDKLLKSSNKPSKNDDWKTLDRKGEPRSHSLIDKIVNNLCTIQLELPDGSTEEVIGEFVEPIYLQIVGERLWEKLISTKNTQISLDNLGDLGDVGKSLADFYEKAVFKAAKETRVYEGDIRIWCEKKLITSSGTRSSVHRGHKWTSGIPTKVLDSLDREHVIRADARSTGKWYELTHDRLIKPLMDSNKKWKENLQNDLKRRKKRSRIIKYTVTAGIVVVLVSALLLNQKSLFPERDSSIPEVRNLGYTINELSINPSTNTIYAAGINPDINPISGANPYENTIPLIKGYNNTISVRDGSDTTVKRVPDILIDKQDNPISPYGLEYEYTLVAINPSTNTIYAASKYSSTISVIDGNTNTIIDYINNVSPYTYGYGPRALAINPSTNTIYAASDSDYSSSSSSTISVIDGNTNIKLQDIPLTEVVSVIAINPSTNTIYAASDSDDSSTISVIDGNTHKQIGYIEVGSLEDLAINTSTNTIYAASGRSPRDIAVIDGNTNTIIDYINNVSPYTYGYGPRALAINPSTNTIYAASDSDYSSSSSSTISVIDGNTNIKLQDIPLTEVVSVIAINPSTNTIYAAGPSNSTISVIDG